MLARMVSISSPCDLPTSASQSAGIIDMSHHAQPKGTLYIAAARENEEDAKVETPDETIRAHETYSRPREQCRGNHPHDSNYLPPGPSHNIWELWEYNFNMRFGWGHRAKPYQRLSQWWNFTYGIGVVDIWWSTQLSILYFIFSYCMNFIACILKNNQPAY